ncbi:nucleotide disphospho-sugar-binding domain-containing protein [Agreia sp. COWG]|uniref:nucleotide disphospho-sugar-binding domain-containing protein n=1 Tax=Agreia sp. COWG TaxID=2773266 RepID=UPI001925D64E|nr:nucleotide disphospho-sugar-binding domain-containing protein [Agreia sp. COWG]CAD5989600.1 Glycosyltransferase, MGT family [Agreia sp. COWG]
MPAYLLCSPPIYGHLQPIVDLGRGLRQRGASVTVLTGRKYEDLVLQSGLAFAPLPGEVDFDDDDLDAWLPGRDKMHGLAAVRYGMIGMFARVIPGQWRAVEALLGSGSFDAIIGEASFTGLAPYLARAPKDRLPVVGVSAVPVIMASVDAAPFGTALQPGTSGLARARNAALNAFLLRGPFRPVELAVKEAMAEVGVAPSGVSFFDFAYRSFDLLFQLSVEGLEYPRRELPDTVSFVGPLRAGGPSGADLPGWWGDLQSGRPVVHVSQGTIDNVDLSRLLVPTLRALAEEDVLVVAATGGRPIADVVTAMGGRLPSNARVAQFLPYDELLPLCDVFVTNGGFGGVQRALAAGIPLVVAGSTEEKPEVAARVQWAGCGVDLRTGTPRPGKVLAAVRRVLGETSYRQASETLRDEIRVLPDPIDVISDALDRLVAGR